MEKGVGERSHKKIGTSLFAITREFSAKCTLTIGPHSACNPLVVATFNIKRPLFFYTYNSLFKIHNRKQNSSFGSSTSSTKAETTKNSNDERFSRMKDRMPCWRQHEHTLSIYDEEIILQFLKL